QPQTGARSCREGTAVSKTVTAASKTVTLHYELPRRDFASFHGPGSSYCSHSRRRYRHRGDAGGFARARSRRTQIRRRIRMARIRLELRLLLEARTHDAGGLVRAALCVRCDLLRRSGLACEGSRSHIAVGFVDPVAAALRS